MFDDPFRFDIDALAERARRVRLRRALLPRHQLARLELIVMFEQLLLRLPDLGSPPTPQLPLRPGQLHQRPRVDAGELHPDQAARR